MDFDKTKYYELTEKKYYKSYGKVAKIVGLTIESIGPAAKLNDLCKITLDPNNPDEFVMAEVVGFRDNRVLLMPYESVEGIGPGCVVESTGHTLEVPVGEEVLGHTLDGLGRPTDGAEFDFKEFYPV